jgi:hypothetical protein
MHRVRAAIISGGASAYRLIASKPGKFGRRRGDAETGSEPALGPAIVARAGGAGFSQQELKAAVHNLRDESTPDDGSLAHWVTCPQADQPLLPKNSSPRDPEEAEEEASLAGEMVPRRESRTADTRREDRIAGIVDTAILTFRDQDHIVRVVNTSSRGLQIESDLKAHIAEEMKIRLDGGAPAACFVRWIRAGRIGLGFREEDIPEELV